jgi:hypothetical protein
MMKSMFDIETGDGCYGFLHDDLQRKSYGI